MASYPTEIKIYIDDVDATYWLFGEDTINPTEIEHEWRDIDITSFIQGAGLHTLKVVPVAGVGRVEARLEIR